MNTWTPLWNSTLDSTLWEEPPTVRLMFFTLLMMRDPDHVVRASMRVVAKRANLDPKPDVSYKLAEEAMKLLESPDTKSLELQKFEGRRIKKVEGGWEILNGQKYLDEMKGLAARVRKTQLQRERRDKERKAQSNGESKKPEVLDTASQPQFQKAQPGKDEDRAPAMAPAPLPVTPPVPMSPPVVDRGSGIPPELRAAAMAARQQPEAPVQKRRGPVQGGVIHVTQAGMRLEREDSEAAAPSSAPRPFSMTGAVPASPSNSPPLNDGQSGLPPLDTEDYPI